MKRAPGDVLEAVKLWLSTACFSGLKGFYRWFVQEELIEFRRARLTAEAVPLNPESRHPPEYTRVSFTGKYVNEDSIYIGPRVRK